MCICNVLGYWTKYSKAFFLGDEIWHPKVNLFSNTRILSWVALRMKLHNMEGYCLYQSVDSFFMEIQSRWWQQNTCSIARLAWIGIGRSLYYLLIGMAIHHTLGHANRLGILSNVFFFGDVDGGSKNSLPFHVSVLCSC